MNKHPEAGPGKSRRGHPHIPRGIEVLVKKASVDRTFRQQLLKTKSGAAELIDLELTKPEIMMLNATPEDHLAAVIDSTSVPERHRSIFLGTAAVLMLAAIGVTVTGCDGVVQTRGVQPDRPPDTDAAAATSRPDTIPAVEGIRPEPAPESEDVAPPESTPADVRVEHTMTLGIRPDRPVQEESKDE
jgi:hypothetical protein